jgi:glycopeptide antibiotics resistance protein
MFVSESYRSQDELKKLSKGLKKLSALQSINLNFSEYVYVRIHYSMTLFFLDARTSMMEA